MGTLLAGTLVVLATFFAIISIIRDRKNKNHSQCGGDCAGCGGCSGSNERPS